MHGEKGTSSSSLSTLNNRFRRQELSACVTFVKGHPAGMQNAERFEGYLRESPDEGFGAVFNFSCQLRVDLISQ